jgi:hypothetical protein
MAERGAMPEPLAEAIERALDAIFPDDSARDVAMGALDDVIAIAWRYIGWQQKLTTLAGLLAYAEQCTSQHSYFKGRKRIVDVEDLVHRWHETLVQLSTGHGHAAYSGAEHSTDELLTPILSAPIAQLREFASKLAAALEADERVPFLVWSSFKRVVAPLILKRPEGDVLTLHTTLAREVAELVEHQIPREDLVAAIAGALQWRSEELLRSVKANVEQGGQPRMVGRQSCLFLVAPNPATGEPAEVIL